MAQQREGHGITPRGQHTSSAASSLASNSHLSPSPSAISSSRPTTSFGAILKAPVRDANQPSEARSTKHQIAVRV